MKDAWDVIILFLIAALVGGILYIGFVVMLKKSFFENRPSIETDTNNAAQKQSLEAQQLKREHEAIMRAQRRQQEQMMRDTQQKIRDLKR